MLTTLLHVALNYVFVIKFEWSIRGTAYAMDITQFISVIALILYTLSQKDLRESWFMPTRAVFKNLVPYFRLAAPSTLMICASWWGFNFQFLVASKISVTAAAV